MKKVSFILTTIFFFSSVFMTRVAFASDSSKGFGCGGGLGVVGESICSILNLSDKEQQKEGVGNMVNTLVGGLITFITVIAGLWFMIQFIIAALQWISAGGDKGLLETARNRILNAVIGLVIVVGAYVLVGLIGLVVGLDILNFANSVLNINFVPTP
jgi:hypothetical protein